MASMSIPGDAAPGSGGITVTGTVAWFDVVKQFGFVARWRRVLAHVGIQGAGYLWIPRGTTLRVRIEDDRGKQRGAEVLEVDTSTARPVENEPILRKPTS
ncbi:hypothetical protein BB934_03745 [Microvirga ossetica]|uniref:Uncharacterized protein n=1 Tax=Microvirga ossetica TaxID=1882682 RepID=A0A1B2EBT2_9HYPH|nr:hypothetical protein BB934_03745 [Microvirga ossetica]